MCSLIIKKKATKKMFNEIGKCCTNCFITKKRSATITDKAVNMKNKIRELVDSIVIEYFA